MDLVSAGRAAIKHWYISGTVVLLAILLALISFLSATTVWNATGMVVVAPPVQAVPPPGRPSDVPGNPLASAGGARLISTLLTNYMNSQEVHGQLSAQGVTSGYSARITDANFPIVTLQVTGSSAEQASADVSRIVGAADPVLARLQQLTAVPNVAAYRAGQAVPNSSPVPSSPDRSRAIIAILVGGLIVAVIAAGVWETIVRRRSSEASRSMDQADNSGVTSGAVGANSHAANTVEITANSSVPQGSSGGAERDA